MSPSTRLLALLSIPLSMLSAACALEALEGEAALDGEAPTEKSLEVVATYQAEDHTFQKGCAFSDRHAGFTGRGFVEFGGNNSMVEWNKIEVPVAGEYELIFRYANGGGEPEPAFVTLNDQKTDGTLAFEPTGGWTSWRTASIRAALRAGRNKIRVTANTGAGGPNLDKLDLAIAPDGATKFCGVAAEGARLELQCPTGQIIRSIDLASYGTATGSCDAGHELSACHAQSSLGTVEDGCLGRASCSIDAKNAVFRAKVGASSSWSSTHATTRTRTRTLALARARGARRCCCSRANPTWRATSTAGCSLRCSTSSMPRLPRREPSASATP
jgi:hypothetical protein